MAGKTTTEKIKELLWKPDQIRNIGIIAHIDHGKSTLSDNLVASAGLMSEELAGKVTWMDFDEQEKERGITIYSANVSMVHEYNDKDYLINLIDTPGHVDFGGDVTRAMRAVDGVILLVDAVESVMPQTETVLRQALKERARPVLFINKVDRLIKELKLTPEQMQERFVKIIAQVNELIKKYSEPDYYWPVKVEDGSVAFGSGFRNWAMSVPYMKKKGVTFKDIIDFTNNDQEKELAKKANISEVLLDMVIRHLPGPKSAQPYRIKKIWQGDENEGVGKTMSVCDPEGPMSGVVVKVYPDPHVGYVAATRLYSGTLKSGQEVSLVGSGKKARVQQVGVYKGPSRERMEKVPAGNIVAIVGLQDAASGETISDVGVEMEPFEAITHVFEPVVTKSLEPKETKHLTKMIEILRQLSKEDPSLEVKINQETGEYLVSGLGELHIEAKVERKLKDEGINVDVSPPIVVYRETVDGTSEPVEGKSPNKHNKFYIKVETVPQGVLDAMRDGKLGNMDIKKKDNDLVKRLEEFGLNSDDARAVKMIHEKNLFVDSTKGVQNLHETMELVKQGFQEIMNEGPLAKEPCMGVLVRLVDADLHEDTIHRGPAQVLPAIRDAIRGAMVRSKPGFYEPKQVVRVDVPMELVGGATNEVSNRRGRIEDMNDESGVSIIKAKVPVGEMFGFDASLKSATGGKGFYSLIEVIFEKLPTELQDKVLEQVRSRKGLKEEA